MPNLVDEIKQRIGATQVELSKYVKVQPIEIEDRKGFVTFGEGNVFPQYLIELYNESPVHGSIVNSIAFMIAGQNLSTTNPQAANEIISDDPMTVQGMDYLVSIGILTQQRRDEILS